MGKTSVHGEKEILEELATNEDVSWFCSPWIIQYQKDGKIKWTFPDVLFYRNTDSKFILLEIKAEYLLASYLASEKHLARVQWCKENNIEFQIIPAKQAKNWNAGIDISEKKFMDCGSTSGCS